MSTYDHDLSLAPANADEWTPRRVGDIYCAPACGGQCKWTEYQAAVAGADHLIARLGEGWEPHIWENLGWHYSVARGSMEVHALTRNGYPTQYSATVSPCEDISLQENDKDPRQAVEAILARFGKLRSSINRALASYALEPLALQQDSTAPHGA